MMESLSFMLVLLAGSALQSRAADWRPARGGWHHGAAEPHDALLQAVSAVDDAPM